MLISPAGVGLTGPRRGKLGLGPRPPAPGPDHPGRAAVPTGRPATVPDPPDPQQHRQDHRLERDRPGRQHDPPADRARQRIAVARPRDPRDARDPEHGHHREHLSDRPGRPPDPGGPGRPVRHPTRRRTVTTVAAAGHRSSLRLPTAPRGTRQHQPRRPSGRHPGRVRSTGPRGDTRRRARLRPAARDGQLIRVQQDIPGLSWLDGSVVAVGRRWVLLALLDGTMVLDGWAAVRTGDLTSIRRAPNHLFVDQLLTGRGQLPAPPPMPGLDLHSTRRLLDTAAHTAPLVTIHTERDHPDECYIGRLTRQGRHRITLQEIDPDARWTRTRRYRRPASPASTSAATTKPPCSRSPPRP